MGNLISNKNNNKEILLSNGETISLLIALILSGSKIAQSNWEITLVQWLVEHDQSILGLGMVGFDLSEIAWARNDFDRQKKFVIDIINDAFESKPWEKFGFHFPGVLNSIDQLKSLVFDFKKEYIDRTDWNWFAKKPDKTIQCKIHHTYLHALHADNNQCCLICNI